MEDLFNMLSSSARIDKSKRKKKKTKIPINNKIMHQSQDDEDNISDDDTSINSSTNHKEEDDDEPKKKRPKKKKQQHSTKKLKQIHNEEIAAFRRRMGIRISNDNKHEMNVNLDPISSFKNWKCPSWWSVYGSVHNNSSMKGGGSENSNNNQAMKLFNNIHQTILNNIEYGKWNEPTPIQMQSLPSLMERRDVMGCAPTGSGKSGAFILPLIMIGKCSEEIYYNQKQQQLISTADVGDEKIVNENDKKRKKKKKKKSTNNNNLQGQIRTILLAPSRELASQLHREIIRLSTNIPNGKFTCITLSKSNVGLATSNTLGSGNTGLDCLVSTPLRLVECLERGMKLSGVRLLVLDEADRLLDASDGHGGGNNSSGSGGDKKKWKKDKKKKHDDDDSDNEDESEDEEEQEDINNTKQQQQSGSSQSRTFLQQIDSILANIPNSATRALFSATLGPSVRHLSESILRSPIDISTGIHAKTGGNSAAGGVASEYIQQELKFVGREEGKLLAIRQLVSQGIKPPVLIFMQSKDRAQALFSELLYDGIHVDVIHAGRSHSHRELAVQKFRRGETWVLICTDLVARGVDFKAVNLVINYDLPSEGVTYVHRIGRTGRAGRQGRAITFFTEADFDNLRTIANVMRLSGCEIPQWMLSMKKKQQTSIAPKRRGDIDTTPRYDKKKKRRRNGNKK